MCTYSERVHTNFAPRDTNCLHTTMKKVLFVLTLICTALCASAHDRGYRGEVGVDYTVGDGDAQVDRLGFSTTHGYQFNPYFFLGGGMAVRIMGESDGYTDLYREAKTSIPVYADLRCNFTKSKVSPFVDLKLGYFLTNNDELYSNISAGLLIKTAKNQGISLSVGLATEALAMEKLYYRPSYKYNNIYVDEVIEYCTGISFQVAYEF